MTTRSRLRQLMLGIVTLCLTACPPYVPPVVGVDGRAIEPTTVATFSGAQIRGLASDGHALFAAVFRYKSGEVGTSQIVRLDASTPTPVVTGLAAPSKVAVDEERVYWLDHPSYEQTDVTLVRAAPKSGGASVDLARIDGGVRDLAADKGRAYWINGKAIEAASNGPAEVVAVDELPIMALAMTKRGVVWATGKHVRAVDAVLYDVKDAWALVGDGEELYWGSSDAVWRGAAGALPRLVAATKLPVHEIATDGTRVFWTERDAHLCTGVLVAPKSGAAARRLDAYCASFPVTTEHGVFWARSDAVMTSLQAP